MPISAASGHPVAGGDPYLQDAVLHGDGTYRMIDVGSPRAGSVLPVANGGTGRASAVVTLVNKPNDPTGTTSATLVMMGLGSAWTLTPASTGKIHLFIVGEAGVTGTSQAIVFGARYGTSTAPTNGAAVSGTAFGSKADFTTTAATGTKYPFAFTDILTLTVGTAYWFDLAIDVAGAQTGTLTNLSITAIEIA